MSFVIAGLVFIAALAWFLLICFAEMMKPIPARGIPGLGVLFGGTALAALIAASHWLPHIGW